MKNDTLEKARAMAQLLHKKVASTVGLSDATVRANAQLYGLDIRELAWVVHALLGAGPADVNLHVASALESLEDAYRDAAAAGWGGDKYTRSASGALLARIQRVNRQLSRALAAHRSRFVPAVLEEA